VLLAHVPATGCQSQSTASHSLQAPRDPALRRPPPNRALARVRCRSITVPSFVGTRVTAVRSARREHTNRGPETTSTQASPAPPAITKDAPEVMDGVAALLHSLVDGLDYETAIEPAQLSENEEKENS